MLKITIKAKEGWDEKNQCFIETKETTICLEHSLVSLSKWESKHKKPYLTKDEKTREEILDYIKCMTITQNVDDTVYTLLDKSELEKINAYITDSMTATWFYDNVENKTKAAPRRNQEQITSELIYYWMFSYRIPISCEKWHLNRLLTLIRIFSVKDSEQSSSNKMSKRDIIAQNRALNAARRQKLGSKG